MTEDRDKWRKYVHGVVSLVSRTAKEQNKLECGPMPNVMVALPNIGGALCSMPQSLADAHYYMPCSNAAKTRKPMKFAGVPKLRFDLSR